MLGKEHLVIYVTNKAVVRTEALLRERVSGFNIPKRGVLMLTTLVLDALLAEGTQAEYFGVLANCTGDEPDFDRLVDFVLDRALPHAVDEVCAALYGGCPKGEAQDNG